MDPFRELGRSLLFFGALLLPVGAFLYFGNKLPFRLGKLPGDIVHRGEHTTFYFPIVTCLVVSVVLTFLFWIISHFRRLVPFCQRGFTLSVAKGSLAVAFLPFRAHVGAQLVYSLDPESGRWRICYRNGDPNE